MKLRIYLTLSLLLIITGSFTYAQDATFGKNKVQYKNFDWYFIQSTHFDVYYSQNGNSLAEFTAEVAESAYYSISRSFRYQIPDRIPIIVYNSHNDFQQTNVVNEYMEEGIGGVTEMFKNRVVVPFEGDYKKFRHVIHHELVHAVINEMFYGGSLQSIISNNITLQLPLWFNEGIAEYEALKWDANSDMFLRDATVHEYLPKIDQLYGYFAYRGGQSVWNYIASKYGDQKIAEILTRIKGSRNVDQGFRSALGLNIEELSEKWQKEQKVLYWPDIAKRKEPSDYARRLTDHRKEGGFYNTSPAISPKGDKLAFISNRHDYFDVFIMNTIDGKIEQKLIKGQRTANFEELHLLTPGMSWSPDGKYIALTAKAGARDAIMIVNVESGDEEKIEFDLDGIFSVDWSPVQSDKPNTRGKLAFVGNHGNNSDIFVYDLGTKELTNLTSDIFSDADPSWSADGNTIYFSSDRDTNISAENISGDFKIYKSNYRQYDLYSVDLKSKAIKRITDYPNSDETSPCATPDGKHLLFISDQNGINNIYIKNLLNDSTPAITNSLSGVYQLSLSKDGNKLAFNSLSNAGFDLFLMRSPVEQPTISGPLELTEYFQRMLAKNISTDSSSTKQAAIQLDEKITIKLERKDTLVTLNSDYGKLDLKNYIFNDIYRDRTNKTTDTIKTSVLTNNIDSSGRYRINKYKINFSPDIIYGSAGYNTFYGVQGSTIMAFSDMLGDHQFYLLLDLQFGLTNSNYALAYFYLPKRIDYGIQGYHNVGFLDIYDPTADQYNRYRFRNYGITGMATYPIDKFNRFEAGLSWMNLRRDNLTDPTISSQKRSVIVPSLGYVHDNSLWGLIAPANGERYLINLMASPKFNSSSLGFISINADYRKYFRLGNMYTLVLRIAGGGSFGKDPQRFVLGGVSNWLNWRVDHNQIPITQAEDFVFLTYGVPLRGFNYNAKTGTKYGMMNAELRFPLFGYFAAGPIPVFFQSFSGAIFLDMGGAYRWRKDFKAFDKDINGNTYMRDLLAGTGYGVRMILLGFLLKMDVAWNFNLQETSTPQYYFSLGADF
ncbi:MAG: PD40 domain-containing protein [Ignavibacteriales bacterium]|nr:PD40 domain-containing protein [Ignavibacteriales bacterium]